MPLFQDNFGTNLTLGTSAGATTSPINSIPTIAAPFYIAFDATNLNSHYEVVYCTAKTATNVNHAATTYDHTTAEEVRLVLPASYINATQNLAEGQILNGKITPSVASNNLTVALKTKAGTDPSTTDPVFVMIGGTLRTITAALSVTKNAGTNWCNAGSAELATKEIDYFVYLGYNATDGVVIGFSRIPSASQYSDFSVTTTNEKFCAISTITTAASTDYYNVIGCFAATLSAGAGYTWTVPTFTAINLIQRPIFETRWLTWVPTIAVAAGTAPTYTDVFYNIYKLRMNDCLIVSNWNNSSGGTAGSGTARVTGTLPFTELVIDQILSRGCSNYENGVSGAITFIRLNNRTIQHCLADQSDYVIGNAQNNVKRNITCSFSYII